MIKFIDLLKSEKQNTKLAIYIYIYIYIQGFELRTRIYYFNWDKTNPSLTLFI